MVSKKQVIAIILILFIGLFLGPRTQIQKSEEWEDQTSLYGEIYDIYWHENFSFINKTGSITANLMFDNRIKYMDDNTLFWFTHDIDVNESDVSIGNYYIYRIEFSDRFRSVLSIDKIDTPLKKIRYSEFYAIDDQYWTIQPRWNETLKYSEFQLIQFDETDILSNRTVPVTNTSLSEYDYMEREWIQIYNDHFYTMEVHYHLNNDGTEEISRFSEINKYSLNTLEQVDAMNLTFNGVKDIYIDNDLLWVKYYSLPYENIVGSDLTDQTITSGYYGYNLNNFFKGDLEIEKSVFQHHGFSPHLSFAYYNNTIREVDRLDLIRAGNFNVIPYTVKITSFGLDTLLGFGISQIQERDKNYVYSSSDINKTIIGYTLIASLILFAIRNKFVNEKRSNNKEIPYIKRD